MTSPKSSRSPRTLIASLCGHLYSAIALVILLVSTAAYADPAATTTTLTVSSSSVPYKSPVTLKATVLSGDSPVTTGIVLFCAQATYCENNSALATVQLTSPNATAVVKLGSGPLGSHSYQAVYRANNLYASSVSNTVTYTVQGTYSSATSIAESGTVGNYTLASTVTGVGSLLNGPTGTVSFLDTSAGNHNLGSPTLGPSKLTESFTTAPNSPFTIGDGLTTTRSVAIDSAYLDGDSNLDVVTGDADQVITVLLGNGDGTFKTKVNYPGCTTGKAIKILLADFNRDGNTDIALGCSNTTTSAGGLVILLGKGDGSFKAPVMYASGTVEGMALGDFNSDGWLDVVVTDQNNKDVTLFTGKGDGTFAAGVVIENPSTTPADIVVGDFNQDGNDDIAYTIANPSKLSDLYVALGKGDGTFNTASKVATQIGEFLTTGDLNADNMPDIVATTITSSTHISQSLFVLLGDNVNKNGTFLTPVKYTSDIPSDPHIADVNGDGIPDIIAGGSYGALVYLGKGDGSFQSYTEPLIGGFSLTYAVNAGDYNNDGNADLIGTDANNPKAAVSLSEVRQSADAKTLAGVAVYPLGSGTHYVEASYSGDTFYGTSTSSTVPLTAAATPTTLTLIASPSTTTVPGQTVTLTATLNPYTVGPPTTTTDGESVNFYAGSTLIGTGTLASGVATMTTTSLSAGNNTLKAIYPGDVNYLTSTSSTTTATVASISLSTAPNPSNYGQLVTFTAVVGTGQTGSVTFYDGATALNTVAITGTTATMSTVSLSAGSHSLTASYSGDGTHPTSTSPVVTQVVNQATPAMSVATSGPSTYGDNVTITATITPGATGTIVFTSGGVTLGSDSIKGSGTASIITASLPAGSDTITATYSGDVNYAGVSATTIQNVSQILTSSALISSTNPAVPGSTVTFTDTVTGATTGTVTFKDGTTTLGTSSLSGGIATYSSSTLALGAHTITAAYGGDNNHASSSASQIETIQKLTPTVTVTTSGPSVYGDPVTITASVPSGPTGTFTITSGGTTLGSGNVSAAGLLTITTSNLPVGDDLITATYSGDSTNNQASGTVTQTVTKASSSMTLTSSQNPSTINQSVTFAAALPAQATGSVNFATGTGSLGSSPIVNGVATLSASSLPLGITTITATYNGDGNYSGSSKTLDQTVNKVHTTVTVTTSGPSTYGNPVTINASVPAGDTGTISISSGGVTLGSGSVSAAGTYSVTTSALPAGSDTITADYSGDATNSSATGTAIQVVSKATPSSTLTSSLSPSTPGASVTFTDTLTTGVTGTVTFTAGSTTISTVSVVNGVAAVTTSSLPDGDNLITATYNGDTNYASIAATLHQSVAKTPTSVTVSTSGPSIYGVSVTVTATVQPGGTGTITFTSGGVTLGSAPLNASGSASISTMALPAGSDTITATYPGDTTYEASSSTATQVVSKASPSLSLASSQNPSLFGRAVTFTATLPTNVTGTVAFTANGTSIGSGAIVNGVATVTISTLSVGSQNIVASYAGDGNNNSASGNLPQTINRATPTVTVTTSGPSTYGDPVTITASVPAGDTGTITITSGGVTLVSNTVSAAGTVTVTTSSLPAGSDLITADYSGDSNNNPATGSATQTVSKATPTVTVTTSGPSTYGDPVTITVSVPPGTTGTVTIISGSTNVTEPINSTTGTATFVTSTLPVGSDLITVNYSGDSNHNSSSGSTTQVVNKQAAAITIVSSNNPSNIGQAVTFTATVPTGATGTVTFYDGAVALGPSTVNNSAATFTTSTLTAGSHAITAVYGGDANNGSATSSQLNQVVNKQTVSIALSSSNNPSTSGQSVTFSATLSSAATGTVTFYDGPSTLGTGSVNGSIATFTTSGLSVGSHSITAAYGGDSTYSAITSSPLSQVVGKASPTLPPPSVSSPTISSGGSETITETVPGGVSGPVTFYNGTDPIGTAPVVGGIATITITTLPVGSDPITASTPGDANNNSATSPPTTVTVAKSSPTITLTSSLNPSTVGQAVTFTASAPANATGSIAFKEAGTPLGTATLTNGVASITVSTFETGAHTIIASYVGDTNYDSGSSLPLTQNVDKGSPSLPAPVVSEPTIPYGGSETITETVPPGVTGPVTFTSGATVIGTAPVIGGTATITVNNLPIGTNPIVASTPADNSNNAATSPATSVTVTKTTPVLPPPTVSNTNPSTGSPVTITEPIPSGVSGPVSFYDNGTLLGTSAVVNGVATLTVPSLPLGSNPITASVPEGPTTNAATSPATMVTVAKSTPPITLISSANPANPGQTVIFTATTTTGATGTVTFSDGATVLGSVPVNGAGLATISVSTLTIGTHTITAAYSGDTNYGASTSAPLSEVINKTGSLITLVQSSSTELLNSPVTFTATVSSPTPTPTGTVTFMDGSTVLGSAPLSTNGVTVSFDLSGNAAWATTSLTMGSHTITAVYSGDGSFTNSSSAPVTNIVQDFTNKNSGSASQKIFPGHTTTFNFTLAPIGAATFMSNVDLAVTGLPEGTTYTFAPATVVAGAGSTSVTLTVTTSSSLQAENHSPGHGGSELPVAFAALGLCGLGVVRKYRRQMPRLLAILLLLAGTLLPVAGLTGCAGGYFALTPKNYTVIVTGTEGTIQHSATATLVVQ